MRIAIDVRREPNSGVGRVAETLASRLALWLAREHQVDLLASAPKPEFQGNPRCVVLDAPPHKQQSSGALNQLLDESRVELFINPNTTWIPAGATPTINIVHDTWMLLNPHWMPSLEEFSERFNVMGDELKAAITEHFEQLDLNRVFTDHGARLFRDSQSQKHQIALMQYAVIVGRSAGVVCVSEKVKQDILKLYQAPKRITVIHNLVENYKSNKPRVPSHFLSLSKLELRKNLGLLLEAYRQYYQRSEVALPLVIAGTKGYREYRTETLARIDKMQQEGMKVRYIGPVESQELPDLFSQTAAVIVTSHAEGFGLPAMEGMLAELPIISTPVGMIGPHVEHYYKVDPGGAEASLVDALIEVQNRPPDPQQLKRANHLVSGAFSPENICQQWVDFINHFTP